MFIPYAAYALSCKPPLNLMDGFPLAAARVRAWPDPVRPLYSFERPNVVACAHFPPTLCATPALILPANQEAWPDPTLPLYSFLSARTVRAFPQPPARSPRLFCPRIRGQRHESGPGPTPCVRFICFERPNSARFSPTPCAKPALILPANQGAVNNARPCCIGVPRARSGHENNPKPKSWFR